MNNVIALLTRVLSGEFVYALGWTILHSLWQSALIAGLLAIGLQCSKKLSSNSRYLLAYTALLLCFFISLITFHSYWEQANQARAALTLEALGFEIPTTVNMQSWFQHWLANANPFLIWIVIAWLVGCSVLSLRGLLDFYSCVRLQNDAQDSAPAHWQQSLTQLRKRAKVTLMVSLRLSHRITSPCTFGHFKPVILLPVSLLTNISPEHIEVILLHELGHIRRKDYAFGMAQMLLKILFFFNPMVLWISSVIDTERENACDDIAMEICQNPMLFSQALQEFVTMNYRRIPATMAIADKKMPLLNRIKRQFTQRGTLSQTVEKSIAAGVLLFSCAAACVYAQTNMPDTETNTEAQLTSWFSKSPAFASLTPNEQQEIVKHHLIEYDKAHFNNAATGETLIQPSADASLKITHFTDPLKRKLTLNKAILAELKNNPTISKQQDNVVLFKDDQNNSVIAVEKIAASATDKLPALQDAYNNATAINKFFAPNTQYQNWKDAAGDLTFKVSYQYLFVVVSPNLVSQALESQPMTAGLPILDYHKSSLVGGSPYAGAVKTANGDLVITYDRTAWEEKHEWMAKNRFYSNSPAASASAGNTPTIEQQRQLLDHYAGLLDKRRQQLMLTDAQYENVFACFYRHYGFAMPDQAKYGLRLGMLQRLYNADERKLADIEYYQQQQLSHFTLGSDNDKFYVNLLTADFSGCDKK